MMENVIWEMEDGHLVASIIQPYLLNYLFFSNKYWHTIHSFPLL